MAIVANGTSFIIGCGNFFFRYRNAAFPLVIAALAIAFTPAYPGGAATLDHLFDIVVLLLALAGQALRCAVDGFENIKHGGVNKRIYADTLVTGGLFAHCRNPLYVGNLLIAFSILLIHGNPRAVMLGGAFFVFVYVAIVAAEEKFLRGKFGREYEAYCETVNRWLPAFRGLRHTLGSMRFNWRRVIIKEYSSVFSWTSAMIALEAYESIINSGWTAARPFIWNIAALWVVLAGAFLTAWILKKRRILSDPTA